LNAKRPEEVTVEVQRDDTPSTFPQMGRQAYLDHPDVDAPDLETHDRTAPKTGAPVTRTGTLSALATEPGDNIVVVGGAFDRHSLPHGTPVRAALEAASGAGLRRLPDLAAVSEETRAHPGQLASGLFSGSASLISGTSTAAPQITRAIVAQLAGSTPPAYQLTKLPQPYINTRDPRLGHGVLPFKPGPGRVRRRMT
jgi:hypothetical protein